MPKLKRKMIVIFLIVVFALYLVTEILPATISKITPTTTIEYGDLVSYDEMTVYFLRDEKVFSAKNNADIDYKTKNGTQVKVGTKIIEYSKSDADDEAIAKEKEKNTDIVKRLGDNVTLVNKNTSLMKGVFSTYIDGYENYFTYKNNKNISEAKAEEYSNSVKDFKTSFKPQNTPIYKVVDNSEWYVVAFMKSDCTSRYQEGNKVKIVFPKGEVDFIVDKIEPEGDKWKIIFSTNRYLEDFEKIRSADVTVDTLNIEAALIPNSCITSKGNDIGVYVVNKTGESEFRRIKTYGTDGKLTAVASDFYYDSDGNLVNTVDIYDEILKNPKQSE